MFRFLFTWWGAFLLAALDSSLFFFAPLGNDALVVYLCARRPDRFWLYPLLTTAGSVTGAALTYWIGSKIGEAGLNRFVPAGRLARLRKRINTAGGLTLALPAALPPPFPLTAFVLTSGALEVGKRPFFVVFTAARLLRFFVEALLAVRYGNGVLRALESPVVRRIVVGLVVVALIGTAVTLVRVWRTTTLSS